jgi:hypothetical protein
MLLRPNRHDKNAMQIGDPRSTALDEILRCAQDDAAGSTALNDSCPRRGRRFSISDFLFAQVRTVNGIGSRSLVGAAKTAASLSG